MIFAQRGIRTLPRGDMQGTRETGTPDTKMLYAYLKHFHGMCASHTSATSMGTDWRDNDPLAEPVVEIYQGDRNNYECEEAPRAITAATHRRACAGGEVIHPQGFVWNALAKGYRFGFESSSDHISTHSSYARRAGGEARAARRSSRPSAPAAATPPPTTSCWWSSAASTSWARSSPPPGKPTLDIRAVGTAPIAKLDIVRNNHFVYSKTPNTAPVEPAMDRLRPAPRPDGLLLCPHPAGRHEPGLGLADVGAAEMSSLAAKNFIGVTPLSRYAQLIDKAWWNRGTF